MFKTTYTQQEIDWLHSNYYQLDYEELEINFQAQFNRFVDGKALRRKCYNDGLRKQIFDINTSLYRVGDGRERCDNQGRRHSRETKFKTQCKKLGIVEALLKGYSPV